MAGNLLINNYSGSLFVAFTSLPRIKVLPFLGNVRAHVMLPIFRPKLFKVIPRQ